MHSIILRRPPAAGAILGRRLGSSTTTNRAAAASHDDHDHHHEDSHQGDEQFPQESFFTPFWRKTVITLGAVAAASLYAEEAGDNAYVTRWIQMYKQPAEFWEKHNTTHTVLVAKTGHDIQENSALPQPVYRYRSPQGIPRGSPHGVPVGLDVDNYPSYP